MCLVFICLVSGIVGDDVDEVLETDTDWLVLGQHPEQIGF